MRSPPALLELAFVESDIDTEVVKEGEGNGPAMGMRYSALAVRLVSPPMERCRKWERNLYALVELRIRGIARDTLTIGLVSWKLTRLGTYRKGCARMSNRAVHLHRRSSSGCWGRYIATESTHIADLGAKPRTFRHSWRDQVVHGSEALVCKQRRDVTDVAADAATWKTAEYSLPSRGAADC